MEETNQDLWPEDIGVTGDLKPPVEILREQASFLAKKTRNLVEGEVKTELIMNTGYFRHSFWLKAPAVNNYRYRLFYIDHPIEMYPLTIEDDYSGRTSSAKSQAEFVEKLKEYFSSDKAKSVIKALVAQSQGAVPVS